jgi:hypothetical protein
MQVISQKLNGLKRPHQHQSQENILLKKLPTEGIYCKPQLVMCHIFLIKMPIMTKLEKKEKKREVQSK